MRLAQHLRQLGEVRRHSSRLVASEQLGRRSPAGLILEVEIGERLPGTVADDEAGVVRLIDRPGRREAAPGGIALRRYSFGFYDRLIDGDNLLPTRLEPLLSGSRHFAATVLQGSVNCSLQRTAIVRSNFKK